MTTSKFSLNALMMSVFLILGCSGQNMDAKQQEATPAETVVEPVEKVSSELDAEPFREPGAFQEPEDYIRDLDASAPIGSCSYFNTEIADSYRSHDDFNLPTATAIFSGDPDALTSAYRADPDEQPFGIEPLVLASSLGCTELIEILIDLGGGADASTEALGAAFGSGNLLAAQVLMDHGADLVDLIVPDEAAQEEFERAEETDPRMIAAEQAWRECMEAQGIETNFNREQFFEDVNLTDLNYIELGWQRGVNTEDIDGYPEFRGYYDWVDDVSFVCEADWVSVREEVKADYRPGLYD